MTETKLIELKTKENLSELPQLKDSIIVHYGCSDFNSNEHKVFWIGAISHEPNKTYFFENRNEIDVIEKFVNFIQENKEKTFIHWSMNSPKFGFIAIRNRYFELTNKEIDLKPKHEIDLSEYLKNKYGINYIERQNGRLNNLAKLNGFSGLQSEIEVININDATNRLELLFSIVQAEIQGNLKTGISLPPQQAETKTEQEQQTGNDFTLSTIEDWLFEFKEKMNKTDYQNLVSALKQYFDTGTFPTLAKPIQINGRLNKKLFGWALNRIFEAKGKGIEKELLLFAKQNISLFVDVQFDETDILKSNLYKYFTTKTQ